MPTPTTSAATISVLILKPKLAPFFFVFLDKTVLFFYPKALTSGCSVEVSDFQRKLSTFKKLGFDIIGASKDDVYRNIKFAEKFKLKYPLGTDAGTACDKLGI